MSAIPFLDVEGLAGAWTLGSVQAGFELVGRRSLPGGFGDNSMDANRALVGDGWEQQTGQYESWDPVHGVGYVCGTPPCSGFSLLNTSKGANARGSGSAINSCMRALVLYAASCRGLDGGLGPEVVAFESVQGAYKQGHDLMLALRDELEYTTGQWYDLTHVLMSGSATGGAQMRHRYYWVAHRIPFGVDPPERRRVITYEDAIGDLVGAAEFGWKAQPYPRDPVSQWAAEKRASALDCHVHAETGAFAKLINELAPLWNPGEDINVAVKRLGKRPEAIKPARYSPDTGLSGWSWPSRIRPNRPGYVLTGAGVLSFVHWSEDRFLTVRETSRLMGYPDTWRWDFCSTPMNASMLIGKCCPVSSGKWISEWVRRAIEGNPGAPGELVGDHEYRHDSTNIYKPWLKEQLAAELQEEEALVAA